MYDANNPLQLNDDNLYAGGQLVVRQDGTAELSALLPVYKPGRGDRFHPELLATDMLDALAYQYWKDEVENAERYWWVLASVNGIDSPHDLAPYVGQRLLVPDIIRYKLLAAAA